MPAHTQGTISQGLSISQPTFMKWVDCLRKIVVQCDIFSHYQFVKELGSGSQGSVIHAKMVNSEENAVSEESLPFSVK